MDSQESEYVNSDAKKNIYNQAKENSSQTNLMQQQPSNRGPEDSQLPAIQQQQQQLSLATQITQKNQTDRQEVSDEKKILNDLKEKIQNEKQQQQQQDDKKLRLNLLNLEEGQKADCEELNSKTQQVKRRTAKRSQTAIKTNNIMSQDKQEGLTKQQNGVTNNVENGLQETKKPDAAFDRLKKKRNSMHVSLQSIDNTLNPLAQQKVDNKDTPNAKGVTPIVNRKVERRQSLSNKLINKFISFVGGHELQNTEDIASPEKHQMALQQINEEEEEFNKDILQKRRMSNRQYVEFQLMMDRQEILNFQEGFIPNGQAEKAPEIKDQHIINLNNEFLEEYQQEVDCLDQMLKEKPGILYPIKKSDFELLALYEDGFPLLELRKFIIFFCKIVSFVCFSIIKSKIFENFILLVIIMNSVVLAMQDPTSTSSSAILDALEDFFLIVYAVECGLKILGLGFVFVKGSYLRDAWNILDFVIVASSFVPLIMGGGSGVNLSSLRSLRVLRPLRTISTIKALKKILQTLFAALPNLMNSIIILLFFYLVFAIAGLQLYMGMLKKRCVDLQTGMEYQSEEVYICGNKSCPDGYTCVKRIANPNFGVTNFDNILYSFLLVFQIVTLEGWSEIMYWVFDAFTEITVLYFVVLIFVGAYFIIQTTLAVIKAEFTDLKGHDDDKIEEDDEDQELKVELSDLLSSRAIERQFYRKRMVNDGIYSQYGVGSTRYKNQHRGSKFGQTNDGFYFNWEEMMRLKQEMDDQREEEQKRKAEQEEQQKILQEQQTKQRNRFQKLMLKSKIMPITGWVNGGAGQNEAHQPAKQILQGNNNEPGAVHRPLPQNRIVVNLRRLQRKSIQKKGKGSASQTPVKSSNDITDFEQMCVVKEKGSLSPTSKRKGRVQFLGMANVNPKEIMKINNNASPSQAAAGQASSPSKTQDDELPSGDEILEIRPRDESQYEWYLRKQANHQQQQQQPSVSTINSINFGNNLISRDKKQQHVTILSLKSKKNMSFVESSIRQNSTKQHITRKDTKDSLESGNNNKSDDNTSELLEMDSPKRRKSPKASIMINGQQQTPNGNGMAVVLLDTGEHLSKQGSLTALRIDIDRINQANNLDAPQVQQKTLNTQMQKNYNERKKSADKLSAIQNSPQHLSPVSNKSGSASNSAVQHQHKESEPGTNKNSNSNSHAKQVQIEAKRDSRKISQLHTPMSSVASGSRMSVRSPLDKEKFQYQESNQQQYTQNDSFRDSDDDSDKGPNFRKNSFSSEGSQKQGPSGGSTGKNRGISLIERRSVLSKLGIKGMDSKQSQNGGDDHRRESAMSSKLGVQGGNDKSRKKSMQADENEISEKSNDEDDEPKHKRESVQELNPKAKQQGSQQKAASHPQEKKESGGEGKSKSEMESEEDEDESDSVKESAENNDNNNVNFNLQNNNENRLNTEEAEGIQQRRKMLNFKDNIKKMQNNFLEWKIGIKFDSELLHSSEEDILRPRIDALEEQMRLDEELQFRQLHFAMVYKFKRDLPKSMLLDLKRNKRSSSHTGSHSQQHSQHQQHSQTHSQTQAQMKSSSAQIDSQTTEGGAKFIGFFPLSYNWRNKNIMQQMIDRRNRFLNYPNQMNQSSSQSKSGFGKKKKKVKQVASQEEQKLELNYEKLQIKLMQPVTKDLKQYEKQRLEQAEAEDNLKMQYRSIIVYFLQKNNFIYFYSQRRDIEFVQKDKEIWSGQDVVQKVKSVDHLNQILAQMNTLRMDFDQWMVGVFGFVIILHKYLCQFMKSNFMNNFLTLAVFANTTVLALDGSFTDEETLAVLDVINQCCTFIFICELVLKLLSLGPGNYLRDKMNIFDGTIVSISIIEMLFLSGGNSAVSAFRAVRIFRTFRVLRVTRLLRGLAFMSVIIKVVGKVAENIMYIALLLFLFIFIYALLGMQIYGGKFMNLKDNDVRTDFDTFQHSFITCFDIMTQENWNSMLNVAWRTDVNYFLTAIYLISWVFMGNWVFLNLFLAVLLDEFDEPENLKIENDDPEYEDNDAALDIFNDEENENNNPSAPADEGNTNQFKKLMKNNDIPLDEDEDKLIQQEMQKKEHKQEVPLYVGIECEDSLYIFNKSNTLRKLCYRIVHHSNFETAILVFIMTSSFKLVIDSYVAEGTALSDVMSNFDYFFNVIFMIEAALKIIAFGFFMDDNSYLTDSWSKLDFFIVFSSLIDMAFDQVNIPAIKILRLLRTLRPLRFISHNINMKIVVIALLESVGAILNVLIVVFFVWVMFAILGMSLIGQRMGYCSVESGDYYGINQQSCLEQGKEWKVWDENFDNILNSLRTLYVITSLEGWPDIMFKMIDSNPPEYGPEKNNYYNIMYFFLIYILVGSYFLMNLFVGVIFLEFNNAQNVERGHSIFESPEQQQWIEFQKMIIGVKAEFAANKGENNLSNNLLNFFKIAPEEIWRLRVYNFVMSQKVDAFIMICIILNIVTMAIDFDTATLQYNTTLENINLVFTSIFIVETTLKIIALGPSGFWLNGWNQFDFFVVCSSIVDLILNSIGSGISFLRVGPQLARIMRVLRVTRLMKLIKSMKKLQKLIETLLFTLPSLVNVGTLLLLVYFIFAVLGVFLFKEVKEGDMINEYNNFWNFGYAMITLFRCSTGENWYQIMFDCSRQPPDCVPGRTCGSNFSSVFFVIFIMMSSFIMLNMFILILIQFFEEYHMKEDNPLDVFNEQVQIFRQHWSKYTESTNGEKMSHKDIVNFLDEIPHPLGYYREDDNGKKLYMDKKVIAKDVMELNLIGDGKGYVYFTEMLFGAMKKQYGSDIQKKASPELERLMKKIEIDTRVQIEEKKKKKYLKDYQQRFQLGDNQKINPMILRLLVQMTFKTWLKFSRRKIRNGEKINESQETFSSTSSEEDVKISSPVLEKKKARNVVGMNKVQESVQQFLKSKDIDGFQTLDQNAEEAMQQEANKQLQQQSLRPSIANLQEDKLSDKSGDEKDVEEQKRKEMRISRAKTGVFSQLQVRGKLPTVIKNPVQRKNSIMYMAQGSAFKNRRPTRNQEDQQQ